MIIASGVIGGYSAKGVVQEQTSDYLYRATALTGIADGKTGLLSFWHRVDSTVPLGAFIFQTGQNGRFRCLQYDDGTGGFIDILGQNTGGSACIGIRSLTAVNDGDWHHCLFSWDTSDAAKCKFYLDGSDDTNLTTIVNQNIDYASGDWDHGFGTGSLTMTHGQAEFYFSTEWLDISLASNREKFAKAGRPVHLGADGSKPTGTPPLVYFKGPASSWGTNYGSGGSFTVNGTFSDTTSPSY